MSDHQRSKFTIDTSRRGFSMVELMVVVGIIGILAAIAAPQFRAFQIKAKQTQAKFYISNARTLVESYIANVGRVPYFTDGVWGAGSSMFLPEHDLLLSNGTHSTATSCNEPNPMGFRIKNCAKSYYSVNLHTSTTGVWGVRADSNLLFGGPFVSADWWAGCRTIPVCNVIDASIHLFDIAEFSQQLLESANAASPRGVCSNCGVWGN